MSTIAVITSRWNSKRFPGKALAKINGKPILQHIVDSVKYLVDDVVVATTIYSPLIGDYCEHNAISYDVYPVEEDFFGRLMWTVIHNPWPECDRILRLWGDQPFLDPGTVSKLLVKAEDFDYTYSQPCFATVITKEALFRAARGMSPHDLYIFNEVNEHTYFINNGYKIGVYEHSCPIVEINTIEDLKKCLK